MSIELDDEAIKKIVEAGRIAAEARDYGARIVKAGKMASEICVAIENFIREKGAEPAFPCNISINEVAAHYTPGLLDDVEIPENSVVKIDVGAHIDGYIGDTAITVDLSGENEKLLEASKEALYVASRVLRPGVSLYEIGKVVQNQIKKRGFKVIRNLSGHTIGRYLIHAGVSIPNYADRLGMVIRIPSGTLLAIEPFATNGRGLVKEGRTTNIYAYTGKRFKGKVSEVEERILNYIVERFRTLPFTPRWLKGVFDIDVHELDGIIKRLEAKKFLHGYPMLIEAGKGLVSQFEHTFLILKDKTIITTKYEGSLI